jgi:hypothetical protein
MGGLVFINGSIPGYASVSIYNLNTSNWDKIAGNLTMAEYHNFAEYSSVHRVLIFGGGNGSRDLYRMESNGSIKKMNTAPMDLGILWGAIATVDPVSGDFLFFGANEQFYAYNPFNDIWRVQHSNVPPIFATGEGSAIGGIVASPVNTYNIVMFLSWNGGDPKVFIYKHKSSVVGNLIPPDPPENLHLVN